MPKLGGIFQKICQHKVPEDVEEIDRLIAEQKQLRKLPIKFFTTSNLFARGTIFPVKNYPFENFDEKIDKF